MRVLTAAVALLWLSGVVQAKEVELGWNMPVQYEDGMEVAPEDIAETKIFVDGALHTTVPAPATSVVVDLRSGVYDVTATVVTTPESYGEGSESAPSTVLVKEVFAPRPNPPTWLEAVVAFFKRVWAWLA